MSVGENSAAMGELIKIGSLDVLGSLKTEVVIAKVIGENDNNIWLVLWAIRFR